VLGISFDSVDDNAAFSKKYQLPFALLCDTDRSVGMSYQACDEPKASYARRISYLIDEQGRIERAYADVDPRDHPARVLADLIDEQA
jgi:peroxiredoxin Q/BCP